MREENCIFCKIAAGEIPSATLYEDDDFRVIMDLAPATKGHSLILPKNHYKNLYEIDDTVASKVSPSRSRIYAAFNMSTESRSAISASTSFSLETKEASTAFFK